MSDAVDALLRRAGLAVSPTQPLAGGDISQVVRAGDGVVKTRADAPADFFAAEARGLRALDAAGMRVPRVIHVEASGIVLEYMAPGEPDWGGLANQLAALHGVRVEEPYGLEHRVYLGRCPLPAGTDSDWTALWWDHRMAPLLQQCGHRVSYIEQDILDLRDRVPLPTEAPVLLHGDLWSGNVHMSRAGAALIDPSSWVGERGVDLAMMQLFGGFPREFWQAYKAELPIPPEVHRALPVYRLYFLLAHVAMFGTGYLRGIREVLKTSWE